MPLISYRRHRFSPEIISHCVWLYFRFQLSFRDVQEMMAAQGVTVSHEAIRGWCEKFGRQYAHAIRVRMQGEVGDRWHLDEVYTKIAGRIRYLWRGVDQDGQVIDVLVQSRRDGYAATRFFKQLRRKAGKAPRLVVTDKLASYAKPCAQVLPDSKHVSNKGQNNRAENSHQPTRQRERRMRKFKSVAQAQKFLSIYSQMCNFFGLVRHTLSASNHRNLLASRLAEWRLLTLPSELI
jgi:putative transposase